MFGGFLKGVKLAGVAGKTMHVLIHYYKFEPDTNRLNSIVERLADFHNEHELAAVYLRFYGLSALDKSEPSYRHIVNRWIETARKAKEVGAIRSESVLDDLCKALLKANL